MLPRERAAVEGMKALDFVKSSTTPAYTSGLPSQEAKGCTQSMALFCGDEAQIAVFVGVRKP
jgi:hypothetical protein